SHGFRRATGHPHKDGITSISTVPQEDHSARTPEDKHLERRAGRQAHTMGRPVGRPHRACGDLINQTAYGVRANGRSSEAALTPASCSSGTTSRSFSNTRPRQAAASLSRPGDAAEIEAIADAMIRLLVGTPLRSDGQSTIKSLEGDCSG
ncbi:hypothetical protein, partial [Streptomyces deserti]